STADRMTDPPACVRRETEAAVVVVPLNGLHEADVSLLDEVSERQTTVVETARDRHHESEVRLHELILGGLQAERFDADRPNVIRERLRRGRKRDGAFDRKTL